MASFPLILALRASGFWYSVYSCWGSALPTTPHTPPPYPTPSSSLGACTHSEKHSRPAHLLLVTSSVDSLLLIESHTALPSHGPHAWTFLSVSQVLAITGL